MTAGRWPKGAEPTLNLGMNNVARAIDEKTLGEQAVANSELAIDQTRGLWALVKLGLGYFPADMQAETRRGFEAHYKTLCKGQKINTQQYQMDCEDLDEAPDLCGGIESLITRRQEPHTKMAAALNHTVRV